MLSGAEAMDKDFARVRMGAVLPKINTLPCAQGKLSVLEWNGQMNRGQGGADMGCHVIISLGPVHKPGIAIHHKLAKKHVQITTHIRIGIFLD